MKYSSFEELPVWKAAIEFDSKPLSLLNAQIFGDWAIRKTNSSVPRCPYLTTLLKALNEERQMS
jgi:hypothetical protein